MRASLVALALATAQAVAGDIRVAIEETPAPRVVLPWYNGGFQSIGSNIACLSDPPIVQIRTQAYTGFALRPPNLTPAVGEVFYTHLVVSHPGNPCAGSAVGVELLLPPGVVTATSPGNPAFCFASAPPNSTRPYAVLYNLANDPAYGCAQVFPQGLEGLRVAAPNGGIGGGAFGMGQGFWLELLIPLVSTQPQVGNHSIRFRINPDIGVVGYTAVPLVVNDDVIFRTSIEGDVLMLDICQVAPTPHGC